MNSALKLDAETFDRMHRGAHYLLNIRPSGDWPAQYFYYAGGVPRVMEEIKDMLHLDVMTVTGKNTGRKPGRAEEKMDSTINAELPGSVEFKRGKM